MKIGFVTTFDAREVGHWSGTPYFMVKALEAQGAAVEFIGPLSEKGAAFFKGKQVFTKLARGRNYLRHREPVILRDYARQIQRHLDGSRCDVVLSPGSVPVSYLECRQPVAIWADATFARMQNYYENFSRLTPGSARDGHAAEQRALDRCRLAVYSSEWAAVSALRDYHLAPEKVCVIPFGANVPWQLAPAEVDALIQSRPLDRCRLLFVGIQWPRKGGAIALDVAKRLNERGFAVELTLIGSGSEAGLPLPDYVRSLGYIDKATIEGRRQMQEEISRTNFLILPARADCSPAVLAEANSLGVPALAPAVGGIPTILRDGVNGYLLAEAAPAEDYCERIMGCSNYTGLARSAYREFEKRLNWQTATCDLIDKLRQLI